MKSASQRFGKVVLQKDDSGTIEINLFCRAFVITIKEKLKKNGTFGCDDIIFVWVVKNSGIHNEFDLIILLSGRGDNSAFGSFQDPPHT